MSILVSALLKQIINFFLGLAKLDDQKKTEYLYAVIFLVFNILIGILMVCYYCYFLRMVKIYESVLSDSDNPYMRHVVVLNRVLFVYLMLTIGYQHLFRPLMYFLGAENVCSEAVNHLFYFDWLFLLWQGS